MSADRVLEDPQGGSGLSEPLEALRRAVERGHHLALIAAEGAGTEALYAAAAQRDLAATEEGGRVFVLTGSDDRAARCAAGMYPILSAADHDLLVATPETLALNEDGGGCAVLIGTAPVLLEQIRGGRLSADALRTLVLDDVRALAPVWPAVEAILQACDDGARRIATTHERDTRFDDLLTHWLPRARRWPGELFPPDGAEERTGTRAGPATSPIFVATHPGASGRISRLTELIQRLAQTDDVSGVGVFTSAEAVTEVRVALSVAGFQLADDGEAEGVTVSDWGGSAASDAIIVLGLPDGLEQLTDVLGSAKRRFAIVDPLFERHLELLARRAGWSTRPTPERADRGLADEVQAFRTRVADAIEESDLASGALLLGPLLEEHGSTRVAAALAELLRRSDPPVDAGAKAPSHSVAPPSPAAERAASPTWTKVFVGVGKRDGAGPGDLLGAITGETPVAGGQIGRIDIRQGHTLVDVDSLVAEQVAQGLNGRKIKGRQVVARLDRDQRR